MQLEHISVPCAVQSAPVMTAPFGQLHVLATQSLDDMWYPASHVPLTQMVAPSDVQLAPVAAVPCVQLHVLATQSLLAKR